MNFQFCLLFLNSFFRKLNQYSISFLLNYFLFYVKNYVTKNFCISHKKFLFSYVQDKDKDRRNKIKIFNFYQQKMLLHYFRLYFATGRLVVTSNSNPLTYKDSACPDFVFLQQKSLYRIFHRFIADDDQIFRETSLSVNEEDV